MYEQYTVPSPDYTTLDAVFLALKEDTNNTNNIEITLTDPTLTHRVSTDLGHVRDDTDLGIGMLLDFNQRTVRIQGQGATLNCGVRILSGTVILNDLTIKNNGRSNLGNGLFCQSASVHLNNCCITKSKIGVWCYVDSKVQLTNSKVIQNKETGVAIYFATCHLSGSTVHSNGKHGIVCSGPQAHCVCDACSIQHHTETGVWCLQQASTVLNGSDIGYNNDGISVDGGRVTRNDCNVHDNTCNIYQDDGATIEETGTAACGGNVPSSMGEKTKTMKGTN